MVSPCRVIPSHGKENVDNSSGEISDEEYAALSEAFDRLAEEFAESRREWSEINRMWERQEEREAERDERFKRSLDCLIRLKRAIRNL